MFTNQSNFKMHMTGMEQFNLQNRQTDPSQTKKKGANNVNSKNPLTNSMVHGG